MPDIYIPPKVNKAEFSLPDNAATAIDSDDKTFMVIWSWGLRCNFDCTYCSPERHNNSSKHTQKEKLLSAVKFLKEYKDMLSQYIDHKQWYISITGGEPTANPYFVSTMKELKILAPEYKLDVTTNGSFSNKIRDEITPVIDHITISYHAESDQKIKQRVKENILYFQNSRVKIKVNLMMHAYKYWDECVALAEELSDAGVNIVPRIIGESLEDNAFNHKYSDEQLEWMKNYWGTIGNRNISQPNLEADGPEVRSVTEHKELIQQNDTTPCACDSEVIEEKIINFIPKNDIEQPAEPYAPEREVVNTVEPVVNASTLGKANIGRYCCGKRDMASLGADTNTWSTSKLVNHTSFKHWHCLINYYFLYIDQEFDQVWHHQTCKANWREGRGKYRDPSKPNGVDDQTPIGTITNYKQILENFKSKIHEDTIPIIQCPRTTCGCGVCIPKAKDARVADALFKKHIKNLKPAWAPALETENK